MAHTTPQKDRAHQSKNGSPPVRMWSPEATRSRLREELIRQRALLLADWNLSFTPLADQPHFPDPADQASSDFEQNLFIQVRTRLIAKLKRIERALLLLRTKHYGYCRRCHKAIPDERLAVQPDTRFCVPCLASIESRTLRN
jgi:RNA polymerase-binding protein DksA